MPTNANAIHIQSAVGGGGGGNRGQDYDKAGAEQGGPGGGSGGAFLSDVVFSLTGGETLTPQIGAAGAAGTTVYSGGGPAGGGNYNFIWVNNRCFVYT